MPMHNRKLPLLALLFLTACGGAGAESGADTSHCTFAVGGFCFIMDFLRIGMYAGGAVLLVAIGLGARHFMSGREVEGTTPQYSDVNDWVKETDDAFGGTAVDTDADPMGRMPDPAMPGAEAEKEEGIGELGADDSGSGEESNPEFAPKAELTAIECPACGAEMKVPKLNQMQEVSCRECGLSGEIEI